MKSKLVKPIQTRTDRVQLHAEESKVVRAQYKSELSK
jgi:hypothetical protein